MCALDISHSSPFILYRMFYGEVQNSSGDGASSSSTAAEANHFCCSDSCSHPPSAEPKSRVQQLLSSDVKVFRWRKELVHGPQAVLSSQQVYTQRLTVQYPDCAWNLWSKAVVLIYWCFWLQAVLEFIKFDNIRKSTEWHLVSVCSAWTRR